MRKAIVVLWLSAAALAVAGTPNKEVGRSLLKREARKTVAGLLDVALDCKMTVAPITGGYGNKAVFEGTINRGGGGIIILGSSASIINNHIINEQGDVMKVVSLHLSLFLNLEDLNCLSFVAATGKHLPG